VINRFAPAGYTQFLLFALIGSVNTLVHGGILVLAVETFNADVVFAHLVAFFIANVFSYTMNSKLTFRMPLSLKYYFRFLTASMMALVLTLLLSWIMDCYGIHYLLGYGVIIVLVPLVTFLTLKLWAFAHCS
jgi:putative flippase GtrA